ncbi:hypothetical protein Tco_1233803, partial [Tanacetum coccineum]
MHSLSQLMFLRSSTCSSSGIPSPRTRILLLTNFNLTIKIVKSMLNYFGKFFVSLQEFQTKSLLNHLLMMLNYKGSLDLVSEMYIDHMYQPWRTFEPSSTSAYLGRLRVLTGSDNQEFKSYDMMNNAIKNLVSYLTYLALSTNTELPKVGKGKGKGPSRNKKADTPKKNSSITVDDNILPDPGEALKLGESMSRIKAKEQEEERRLHETHVSIIIGREVTREADSGVVEYQKKKKMKEVASEP